MASKPSEQRQLRRPLSVQEASELLGQSRWRTYADADAGLLGKQFIGVSKVKYNIPVADVVNLIALRTEKCPKLDKVKELAGQLPQAQQEKLLKFLERELRLGGHEAVLRAG